MKEGKYVSIVHIPGPTLKVGPDNKPAIIPSHNLGVSGTQSLNDRLRQGYVLIAYTTHHSAKNDCTVTMYTLGLP